MKKLRRIVYLKIARLMGRGKNGNVVPTIIAENSSLKGDVVSAGTLHVDGNIDGDVNCDELIVGLKGTINGSVNAQSIYLYGSLNGEVCTDSFFIAQTAHLVGDIKHNSIKAESSKVVCR